MTTPQHPPLVTQSDLNLAFYEASDWSLDVRDMQGVDLMENAARKVAHEGEELAEDESLDEWADVFIALAGVAEKHAWTAGDLARAVCRKVEVNRHRTWVQQPDGTFQHNARHREVLAAEKALALRVSPDEIARLVADDASGPSAPTGEPDGAQ